MGERVTKPSGTIYDQNGNAVGTFTTNDQGDTLIIDIEGLVLTFTFIPNILFGGGSYYNQATIAAATYNFVCTCINQTPDGCTKWSYDSWSRPNTESPWGHDPAYGGKIY